MSIRTKTLLIVSLTLAGMILVLYAASTTLFLGGFSRIEEESARQNVRRVLEAVSESKSTLNSSAWDWANWDQTYAFIEDADPAFIKSNPTDKSFTELRINLMLMIHSSGSTVFGKAFDLENQIEVELPPELQGNFETSDPLLLHQDTQSSRVGLVLLAGNPMFIASRPILTSEGKGPIRGTLIMGRYLDAVEIDRISEKTQLNVSVHLFDKLDLPRDLESAKGPLSSGEPIFVKLLSEDLIAGYSLLRDIYGKPALLLRVDMPRTVYRQGQVTVGYLLLSLLCIGFVFAGVTLLLLERLVLSRLMNLSHSVRAIGKTEDLDVRIPVAGKDELSAVAVAINDVLEDLEDSQSELRKAHDNMERRVERRTVELARSNEELKAEIHERKRIESALRQSEERYRAIVEDQTELVSRFLPDGTLTFVNDAYCHYFGETREWLLGSKFWHHIPEEEQKMLKEHIGSLQRQKPVATIEHRVIMAGGEVRWQQWTDRAIFDERDTLSEFQAVGRDITELKESEEALRQARDNLERAVEERTAELERSNEKLQREIEEHERTEDFLKKSEERLRVLSSKLLNIQEEERRRLAQELHDSIGQALVGTKYRLEHFHKRVQGGNFTEMIEELDKLIEMLQNGIDEIRRICTGLRPFILDDFGILAGVEWLCDQLRLSCPGIDVKEKIHIEEAQIPESLKMSIFRILQEALWNAAKYSRADSVEIFLAKAEGGIELSAKDDGIGFDVESILSRGPHRGGLGLTNMRERAELSGGSFSIESRPGSGTKVRAFWPLNKQTILQP